MSNMTIDEIFKEESSRAVQTRMDLIDLARKGITKRSLRRLSEISSITVKELAELLPISLRQFQRYDEEKRMKRDVSEHVILIAEVFLKGMDIFDSPEELKLWLKSPLLSFGQRTPFGLLDTSYGVQMVMDELGRMEHGVYS
ncbi:MAG: antitoxin Xre/MbcA/ParS toxin-binding domain-containing protein [Balneolaceae bacterium]